ncbi:hypothetical protein BRADI_2g09225v3 [Brachypodium distachyon]|uniref:RNase H type-1 domain-containing protein n=1 Tax=Brachypodium distachyon TaxID=15368 RepID=A0A0Q3JYU8_BRADI|nr:hypothetical protein BRADI_2g09225v3 [Brachypodium distachyon]
MFLWRRCWHLRNDIIFSKGDASVTASAHFLFNYEEAMNSTKGRPLLPDLKGKQAIGAPSCSSVISVPKTSKWELPDTGWAKLNIDASFIQSSGAAAWGGVLRDDRGGVIASGWDIITNCQSAEMAEGVACFEGIKFARSCSSRPIIVESDCQSLIQTLADPASPRSLLRPVIEEIQQLIPFDPASGTLLRGICWQGSEEVSKELCDLVRRFSERHKRLKAHGEIFQSLAVDVWCFILHWQCCYET